MSYDTKATITSQKGLERSLDEDIPEIIIGGKLDLVDLAIEQLALVLNDYPRKPGENFEFTPSFDINEPIKSNPFEVLKTLKK